VHSFVNYAIFLELCGWAIWGWLCDIAPLRNTRRHASCVSKVQCLVMFSIFKRYICYLLAREVRIVKNCDLGHSCSIYGPTLSRKITYLFFSKLSNEKKLTEKKLTSVTVTVVRDRKIQTALRTSRIAGFITVPAWKKIKIVIVVPCCKIMPLEWQNIIQSMSMWKTHHPARDVS